MRQRNVIGSQVRRQRLLRGWSQEQLTAKLQLQGLEISRSSVAKIENGIQAVFDYELLAFSHLFNVSEEALHPTLDPISSDFRRKFLEFMGHE